MGTATKERRSQAAKVIRGIETFAAGSYPGETEGETWDYSPADIRTIARNFAVLSSGANPLHTVPVVRTHDEVHAYGTVAAAKADGDLLTTDWADVEAHLADAIRAKKLLKVSAEIKRDFKDKDGRVVAPGPYLYRIAVLGADVPRVKGLADLPADRFADQQPGQRIDRPLSFAEPAMTRDEAIAALTAAGMDPAVITPDVPDAFLIAVAGMMAAPTDPNAGVYADPDEEDDALPPVTRKALGGSKPGSAFDEDDDEDNWPPGSDRRASGATSRRPGSPPPKKRTVTEMYADPRKLSKLIARTIKQQLAGATAELGKLTAAEKAAREQRAAEERQAAVRLFCDRNTQAGRLTPADNDEGSPLSVRSRLLRLAQQPPTVHRFADPTDPKKQLQKTELELQQEEIERREVRRFSERVRTAGAGGNGAPADPYRERAEKYYETELKKHEARTAAARRN